MSDPKPKPGDRVRLIGTHPLGSPVLRKRVGDCGTVAEESSSTGDNRLLVRFDTPDVGGGQWWVRPKYLERLEDTGGDEE